MDISNARNCSYHYVRASSLYCCPIKDYNILSYLQKIQIRQISFTITNASYKMYKTVVQFYKQPIVYGQQYRKTVSLLFSPVSNQDYLDHLSWWKNKDIKRKYGFGGILVHILPALFKSLNVTKNKKLFILKGQCYIASAN